ncbi:hypothetical protein PanWU01x14_260730 [Parasponia andersonii]|uniref:Uncharacterized protein n=1 Tax=Parasponia andersonii TaxID=3476 RepID=A0A2P5B8W5_PARAD|nr:hypothetical protein PanWU01x14_260730 [Parasponia andersonii]
MNAMTASNQKSQYGYHQVDESNYDLDQHGMSKQKANRYGSEIQAHNGAPMRPYPGHVGSAHTQHNQNSCNDDQAMTSNHGGHYLTHQPYHGPSGIGYGNIGGQPKKSIRKGEECFTSPKLRTCLVLRAITIGIGTSTITVTASTIAAAATMMMMNPAVILRVALTVTGEAAGLW